MRNIWSNFKPLVSAFFGSSPKKALIDIANNFSVAVTGENISKVMLAVNKFDMLNPVRNAMSWVRPTYGQLRGMMGFSGYTGSSAPPKREPK